MTVDGVLVKKTSYGHFIQVALSYSLWMIWRVYHSIMASDITLNLYTQDIGLNWMDVKLRSNWNIDEFFNMV